MTYQLPADSRLVQPDFIFGVATASFQIEGSRHSRLPCIWDTFCATAGKIRDSSTGETACDHVRLFREDVALIKSLGVDAYRLSISWGRVLDEHGELNHQGVQFYIDLLDELIAQQIKPFVTLYHWDLPQFIEDRGGWLVRETAYLFADYADKISQALGDRVYSWATLNEPFCSAYLGYEVGIHAPGLAEQAKGRQAAHHLLLAHGLAMPILRQNCPNAEVGIVLNFTPAYPLTDSLADVKAAQLADDYLNQWYIKPLLEGCYPDCFAELGAATPKVQPEDFAIMQAPLDYIGINFYTRAVYQADGAVGYRQVYLPNVPRTDMGWEIYPQSFTDLLVDLTRRYRLPPLYITENGCAAPDELQDGKVADLMRVDYYQQHLSAVDAAVRQGADIRGYFAWSLMDNFEWAEGYTKRFGIVYVDYPTQARVIKQSGLAYRDFLQGRSKCVSTR